MLITTSGVLSNALRYVDYIRSNSFQQPPDREEETRCISLLSERDEETRNKLVEHNLRLVVHIVKKYDIRKEQTEDLINIDTIELAKAVDSSKPEEGHKLATYTSKCIEDGILMYLRSNRNYFQNVSLNEPIATDKDGNEITLTDAISSPEDNSIINDMIVEGNIARLKRYIHVLDVKELEIIVKCFGLYGQEEETQREIARQLYISRPYVSQIKKRAFMKVYWEFQKEKKRKERLCQNKGKE